MGPTVWLLLGPMPILKRSKTDMALAQTSPSSPSGTQLQNRLRSP